MKKRCTVCKSSDIIELLVEDSIIIDDQKYFVDVEYTLCNNCKREFITSEQIQRNDQRIKKLRKSH